eukprot:symbB.v1.2.029742.t2/scaffold3290.1/size59655/5
MNAQEENRKSSSGSRRQEVIKEELSRISSGRPSTGHTSKSLRSTVRTVIAQELQNARPLGKCVGGVLQKCPPPWSNETSTAPVLPSKYRELSWWLWASVNPEYQIYPEVVEMRNAYPWHKDAGPDTRIFMNPKDDFIEYRRAKFQPGNKLTMRTGANAAQLAQGNGHEELAQMLEREVERHVSIDGGYYISWQLKRAFNGTKALYHKVTPILPSIHPLLLVLLVLAEVCIITLGKSCGFAFFIAGFSMALTVPLHLASLNPYSFSRPGREGL